MGLKELVVRLRHNTLLEQLPESHSNCVSLLHDLLILLGPREVKEASPALQAPAETDGALVFHYAVSDRSIVERQLLAVAHRPHSRHGKGKLPVLGNGLDLAGWVATVAEAAKRKAMRGEAR